MSKRKRQIKKNERKRVRKDIEHSMDSLSAFLDGKVGTGVSITTYEKDKVSGKWYRRKYTQLKGKIISSEEITDPKLLNLLQNSQEDGK